MAMHEPLEIGNNHIIDNDAEFTSDFSNGNLLHYDTNSHVSHPLSCQSVYRFMQENLSDQSATNRWNTGFVFGWIVALSENCPDCFFTSILLAEPTTVTEPLLKLEQQQE
jgi:hypothetical protein